MSDNLNTRRLKHVGSLAMLFARQSSDLLYLSWYAASSSHRVLPPPNSARMCSARKRSLVALFEWWYLMELLRRCVPRPKLHGLAGPKQMKPPGMTSLAGFAHLVA